MQDLEQTVVLLQLICASARFLLIFLLYFMGGFAPLFSTLANRVRVAPATNLHFLAPAVSGPRVAKE